MKHLSKHLLQKLLTNLPEHADVNKKSVVKTDKNFTKELTIGQYLSLYTGKNRYGLPLLLPHPRQRETLDRLKKAAGAGGHLHEFSAAHTEIVLAYYKGQLYLVDGNHRTRMWLEYPDSPKPSNVTLIVKSFDDEKEFINIYYAYDSKASLETGRQKLYGYMGAAGYAEQLKTKFMKDGKFLSTLKHLPGHSKGRDAELLLGWKSEVLALDTDLARTGQVFHCGVLAALLISYRSNPIELVSDFFWQIQNIKYVRKVDEDTDIDFTMSPAQRIIDNFERNLKEVFGKGNELTIELKMESTLTAFTNYRIAIKAAELKVSPRKRLKKAA